MDDFVLGFAKFVRAPTLRPFCDAPDKAKQYAQDPAISRLRPI
jgi:hypothetical protein